MRPRRHLRVQGARTARVDVDVDAVFSDLTTGGGGPGQRAVTKGCLFL